MPVHDNIGIRMKTYYESIPKTKLMRRTPVVIRIDGKAFHSFTRGFKKPYDEVLIKSMQETTKYLCENIQGCVLGYTQSDEISLVLVDYKNLNTSAWFDYEVQKMCSIAASMATLAFNKIFEKNVQEEIIDYKTSLTPQSIELQQEIEKYHHTLITAVKKGAMFDARVFNIPKEEVTNYIYWRQLDAIRNSIQMLGQANFSHKELQNKTCNNIKDMLITQKNINWDNLAIYKQRGTCCIKMPEYDLGWTIDKDIPIFKDENRNYIDSLVLLN
jgi:tRNA(His) 5'-end guanylyltransferase